MPQMKIRDAATSLGVSDDTVRRWIRQGTLKVTTDAAGHQVVDGYDLALVAREHSSPPTLPHGLRRAAGNRFVGLVTNIEVGPVMARVELQSGPFTIVSLMTTDAVRDLGLELGSLVVAAVEHTSVVVETPASGPALPRRRGRWHPRKTDAAAHTEGEWGG